jgi:hypothetical protein
MIKMLLTFAVLGSVGSFAGPAMAQGKQGEAPSSDTSRLLAKLEAQCAHRRIMPPDPRDDCVRKLNRLRSAAQIGSGQDGSANNSQASAAGPGNGSGIGNGGGQGNGIGPGNGGGGGRGNGRR